MKQQHLIDTLNIIQGITQAVTETRKQCQARLAVEALESEVLRTGDDLANLVVATPFGGGITPPIRAQAKLYLRRHKAAKKARLFYTIDYVQESAKQIDRMVPDAGQE